MRVGLIIWMHVNYEGVHEVISTLIVFPIQPHSLQHMMIAR